MTADNKPCIRKIFHIFHIISILVAGACLIAGCLSIYSFGAGEYTRQIVIETFSKISVPVYLCIILTVVGFIWDFALPVQYESKLKDKNHNHILLNLYHKKDLEMCDEKLLKCINAERKSRKIHSIIRTIIICISILVFLGYALNSNNYDSDINSSVIKAMYVLIPCWLIPFAYSIFTAFYSEKSIKKEIELLKSVTAKENTQKTENISKNKTITVVRFALLLISIAFVVYGYCAGGTADVLTKAINICTECIGLG